MSLVVMVCSDAREYSCVPTILDMLKIKSVNLITNNPRKIRQLRRCVCLFLPAMQRCCDCHSATHRLLCVSRHGVDISGRIPLVIAGNEHSDKYLAAKRSRMGHLGAST
jgi:GTP cyclohydrolase II